MNTFEEQFVLEQISSDVSTPISGNPSPPHNDDNFSFMDNSFLNSMDYSLVGLEELMPVTNVASTQAQTQIQQPLTIQIPSYLSQPLQQPQQPQAQIISVPPTTKSSPTKKAAKQSATQSAAAAKKQQEKQEKQQQAAASATASKPSKKRRRVDEDDSENEDVDNDQPILGGNTVTLPKEMLLKMSSSDLSSHLSKINLGREFTRDEQAEIARMKRLVRNRESAQASRQRKRDKLQELEAKVTKLEGEKGELKRYALTLETDNRRLREQLQQLASVRQFGDQHAGQWQQQQQQQQSQSNSCSPQQSDSSPELSLQFGEKFQHHHKQAPLINDKTKKVALMILCFTFGIWMKSQMPVTNVPAYPKYVREPIPEVIPESLANARSQMVAVQQPHQPQPTQHAAASTAVHVGRDIKELAIEKATRSTVPSANTTFENVTPSEFVNSSASVQMDNADESPLTQYLSYKNNDHPNTAIMTCSNLRQIVPSNSKTPLNSNEPLYISLVVPPNSKGGSHQNTIGENSTTFTEITCRVESVKTVTLGFDSIIPADV